MWRRHLRAHKAARNKEPRTARSSDRPNNKGNDLDSRKGNKGSDPRVKDRHKAPDNRDPQIKDLNNNRADKPELLNRVDKTDPDNKEANLDPVNKEVLHDPVNRQVKHGPAMDQEPQPENHVRLNRVETWKGRCHYRDAMEKNPIKRTKRNNL